MLTVLSIIGTRPEAIKMAPIIQEIGDRGDALRSVVCVTGQHRQMLDQVMTVFRIQPDYDLNVMQPNQTLSDLTARLFTELDPVVRAVQPDWILAQGDTTTVLVSSLIAYYNRVQFGHVEAGLRTRNKYHPFPEEVNRRVADVIADAFFAPTERSRQNLLRENVPDNKIFVTGNPVVDAMLKIVNQPYNWDTGILADIPRDKRIVLITAHRRESFGEPFRNICEAIRELALRFASDGVQFVYPVHLNPNVRQPVYDRLVDLPNVSLIEPLDYLTFIHLMKAASVILTDSGGVQEEAPSFSVPVLVMRDETERPEGIEAGVVKLIGTQTQQIVDHVDLLLRDQSAAGFNQSRINPYGDGQAARRIVSVLLGTSL